jgi:hypothetical protein
MKIRIGVDMNKCSESLDKSNYWLRSVDTYDENEDSRRQIAKVYRQGISWT